MRHGFPLLKLAYLCLQVIVEVHAASLNPCDYKFRRNYIPSFVRPLPNIPGGMLHVKVTFLGKLRQYVY
jgi:hypothetical protein